MLRKNDLTIPSHYYQIEFWSIVKVALVSEELCLLASFSKPTLLLVPDQVPLAKWNIVQLFITCDTAFWDIKGFFQIFLRKCLFVFFLQDHVGGWYDNGMVLYVWHLSVYIYTKISKGSKGEVYSSLWARNPGGRNWGGINSSCCFSCTLRRLKSCSSTTCQRPKYFLTHLTNGQKPNLEEEKYLSTHLQLPLLLQLLLCLHLGCKDTLYEQWWWWRWIGNIGWCIWCMIQGVFFSLVPQCD